MNASGTGNGRRRVRGMESWWSFSVHAPTTKYGPFRTNIYQLLRTYFLKPVIQNQINVDPTPTASGRLKRSGRPSCPSDVKQNKRHGSVCSRRPVPAACTLLATFGNSVGTFITYSVRKTPARTRLNYFNLVFRLASRFRVREHSPSPNDRQNVHALRAKICWKRPSGVCFEVKTNFFARKIKLHGALLLALFHYLLRSRQTPSKNLQCPLGTRSEINTAPVSHRSLAHAGRVFVYSVMSAFSII